MTVNVGYIPVNVVGYIAVNIVVGYIPVNSVEGCIPVNFIKKTFKLLVLHA